MKKTYVVCYNTLDIFTSRENAIKFYKNCACWCDPMSCEYSRYSSVVMDLISSNIGLDNVDNYVWNICYHDNNNNVIKKIKIDAQDYKKAIEKIEKGEIYD